MMCRICDTMRGIRPSVGSSSRMIFGSSIIARAIASICCSPPDSVPRMVSQIRHIIHVLRREGVAVLLVEQNVPLTLETSERVYFMEKGQVRHHAPASELHADHEVVHRYLGV